MSIIYCAACDDAYDSDHHDHGVICKRCLSAISTEYVAEAPDKSDCGWIATFDPAPHSPLRSKLRGKGQTEDDAILNLIHAI